MWSKQQHAELNVGNGPWDAGYSRLQNVNLFQVDYVKMLENTMLILTFPQVVKLRNATPTWIALRKSISTGCTHIFSKQTQWSDGNWYQQIKSVVILQEPPWAHGVAHTFEKHFSTLRLGDAYVQLRIWPSLSFCLLEPSHYLNQSSFRPPGTDFNRI